MSGFKVSYYENGVYITKDVESILQMKTVLQLLDHHILVIQVLKLKLQQRHHKILKIAMQIDMVQII